MNPPVREKRNPSTAVALFLAAALVGIAVSVPVLAGDGHTAIREIIANDEGIHAWSAEFNRNGVLSIDRRIDRRKDDSEDRSRVRYRRHGRDVGERQFEMRHDGGIAYERVNGLSFWNAVRGRGGERYVPEIDTRASYGFASKRWYYDLQIMQPIIPTRSLLVGGGIFRRTATHEFDQEIVGDMENSLAAALFKEDFRDYYETEGYEAMAEIRFGEGRSLRGGYVREDLTGMDVKASWSLFHGDENFRANAPINEGELHALRGTFTLDARRGHGFPGLGLGVYWRLDAEIAGGDDLGGDFYYDCYTADLRHYTKLGPNLDLDVRLAGGYLDAESSVGSLYPLHKEFYVGGISTLPGYTHKQFTGDRMLLGNVEYRVGRESKMIFLADAGDAWQDGVEKFRVHADVGLGFETDDDGLRVIAARRVDDNNGDVALWVRLKRTF